MNIQRCFAPIGGRFEPESVAGFAGIYKRPHSALGNATPEEFAAQIDPETARLNWDFEAAKNGLHI